jgi:PKD repeat protein
VIASWSAEPQTLLDPSAHFAGSCTGCTSWTIDFGDGAQTSGSGSTVDVSHHYAGLLDRYDATLTVHGPGGSRSRTITVSVQLL